MPETGRHKVERASTSTVGLFAQPRAPIFERGSGTLSRPVRSISYVTTGRNPIVSDDRIASVNWKRFIGRGLRRSLLPHTHNSIQTGLLVHSSTLGEALHSKGISVVASWPLPPLRGKISWRVAVGRICKPASPFRSFVHRGTNTPTALTQKTLDW